jgi:hypothetical protein
MIEWKLEDDKKLQGKYFDNIPRLPEAGNNGTS